MKLDELAAGRRLLVVVGAGGTGKTRLAMRLATAAMDAGRSSLILATEEGPGSPGQVETKVVRAAESWDRVLVAHGASTRLRHNPLYRVITESFSGTRAAAMAAELVAQVEADRDRLLVVEPPPGDEAMAFLDMGRRIHGYFDAGLQRWLGTGYDLVHGQRGSAPWNVRFAFRRLEAAVGRETLSQASELFHDVALLEPSLREAADAFDRLLRAPTTTILIVTTASEHGVQGTVEILAQLERMALGPATVVVNRLGTPMTLEAVVARLPTGTRICVDAEPRLTSVAC